MRLLGFSDTVIRLARRRARDRLYLVVPELSDEAESAIVTFALNVERQ